jgi:hypothetical protein
LEAAKFLMFDFNTVCDFVYSCAMRIFLGYANQEMSLFLSLVGSPKYLSSFSPLVLIYIK